MLKNIWASGGISTRTKLRIFNSRVKSILLYRCETWWTTQTMQQKIKRFFNSCLRRIYKIRWQQKIRNEDLWERAGQEPVAKQTLEVGLDRTHPLEASSQHHIQSPDLEPAEEEEEEEGRPRNSWRRNIEAELKQGINLTGMPRATQNRVRWRRVVDGQCSTGSDAHK